MNTQQEKIIPTEGKKWSVALFLMLCYGAGAVGYMTWIYGFQPTLSFWSSIAALVAGMLLATSLSASNFNYFFGWPDMKLGYQKQIGVLAFWLCVVYCLTLLELEPEIYASGLAENFFTPNILLGLAAMVIFGLMVFINSKPIAKYFSWPTIGFFLRLGYWGYAALVVRAAFLEWPLWVEWFTTFDGIPTNRLLLSMLAVVVIGMRIAAVQSKRRAKKSLPK